MEAQDSAIELLSLILLALSLWTVIIIAVCVPSESRKKVLRWLGQITRPQL